MSKLETYQGTLETLTKTIARQLGSLNRDCSSLVRADRPEVPGYFRPIGPNEDIILSLCVHFSCSCTHKAFLTLCCVGIHWLASHDARASPSQRSVGHRPVVCRYRGIRNRTLKTSLMLLKCEMMVLWRDWKIDWGVFEGDGFNEQNSRRKRKRHLGYPRLGSSLTSGQSAGTKGNALGKA